MTHDREEQNAGLGPSNAMPYGSLERLSPDAFLSLAAMEGIYQPIVETGSDAARRMVARQNLRPGVLLACLVAGSAYAIHYLPFPPFLIRGHAGAERPISAAIMAILLGVMVRNLLPVPGSFSPGCKRIVHGLIPIAIVLTGAGMNLGKLAEIGPGALFITLLCMTIAMASAIGFGRVFGLGRRLAMLIGCGTSICGSSAIVAVAPLIDAEDEEIALSVGTVNLCGLVAMLLCPVAGALMHMASDAFGVWAGTSIQAVPQVVAAGFAHDLEAGRIATLVKLVRVALLAPMVFALAILSARRRMASHTAQDRLIFHYARLVPWFVWGFAATSLLGTYGLIPELRFGPDSALGGGSIPMTGAMTSAGKGLLTLAMAAIGLEVRFKVLATVGVRAILTGAAAGALLLVASLLLTRMLL